MNEAVKETGDEKPLSAEVERSLRWRDLEALDVDAARERLRRRLNEMRREEQERLEQLVEKYPISDDVIALARDWNHWKAAEKHQADHPEMEFGDAFRVVQAAFKSLVMEQVRAIESPEWQLFFAKLAGLHELVEELKGNG